MAPPTTRRNVQHSPPRAAVQAAQPEGEGHQENAAAQPIQPAPQPVQPAPQPVQPAPQPIPSGPAAQQQPEQQQRELQARAVEDVQDNKDERKQLAACAVPVPVRLTQEPPKFKPNDDAGRWIKLFERAASHNAWQEEFKLQSAELCMSGLALQWAETQADRLKSWKEWRQAFLRRFDSGRIAKAKQQLRNLVRAEDESLLDHLDRVQWLCHQINPSMADEDVIEHFGNTISEEEFAHIAADDLVADLEGIRRVLEKRQRQAATRNKAPEVKHVSAPTATLAAVRPRSSELNRSFDRTEPNEGQNRGRPENRGYPSDRPREPKYSPYRKNFAGDRRAYDGRPVCNYCDRVGHIAKHCRDLDDGLPAAKNPQRLRPQTPPGDIPRRSPSPRRHSGNGYGRPS
ncbi:uncharacterized protein LOC108864033 [Galendromus occidentalis]|uniref:Uncharacterized protein LOC108864033 n=1 Tax=Galendromus occidentalis TaxID=34638 RepID=A0AAJ7L579_9ACAR|nr:uncharacterized protein LOC108864033 [Galendromus occidentalis]